MKLYKAILLTALFALLGIFLCYESWGAIQQHWMLFMRWYHSSNISYYPWYIWLLIGSVIFPLMNKYFVKNIDLIKTFTHELTHTITGLLLFRRIHSFHAEERSGEVWTSGNDKLRFLTSLAPYCFPIYTFPFLMWRCIIIPEYYPIVDVLVGVTIGVHIVCIIEQTHRNQTDISQFPIFFSGTYICSVWLFDCSILLLSYLPGSNIFMVFWRCALDLWHLIF